MIIKAELDGIEYRFEVVYLGGHYIMNAEGIHSTYYDSSGSIRSGVKLSKLGQVFKSESTMEEKRLIEERIWKSLKDNNET